jgi:nucleotide-binding universal stress UspA family protein
VGEVAPVVARCGRLSDIIVLNRPSFSFASGEAFDAAVFESGRPTLLVSNTVSRNLLRHMVIAWNGSLEATRAVAGSMTLLHEAQQVSIFTTLDEETIEKDLDLAESLSWHGIHPCYLRPHPGEKSAGEALLRILGEVKPSMLVMGAYTHSRLRETFLGGVTREILAQAEIPVLMMH